MHFLIFFFVNVAQFRAMIFYVLTFCTNLLFLLDKYLDFDVFSSDYFLIILISSIYSLLFHRAK